jgi:hypothetical protein
LGCGADTHLNGYINFLKINIQKLLDYREANGIKLLCPNGKNSLEYTDFIFDLYNFYEYDIKE